MTAEDWIAPIITGLFGLILAVVAAILARRGAHMGNKEQRAPDVQELWIQQEADRRMRQIVEDLWWGVRRAFQSYFRRVTNEVAKLGLSESQARAFELTNSELRAIEAALPEDD